MALNTFGGQMKKHLFLVLASLSMAVHAFGYYDCGSGGTFCSDCFGFDSVLVFDVGGGYRNDNLKWKLHPNSDPNTKIDEKWKNIGVGTINADAYFLVCEHYLVKANFDYGWFSKSGHQSFNICNGTAVHHDLKSRTHGRVYDLSGGLGYQFNFDCLHLTLAPLAGYSYDFQLFKNNKYEHAETEHEGFQRLHNKYKYRWGGPWVGAAIAFQPCCDLMFFVDYNFHWANLHADIDEKFDWHKRDARITSKKAYGNEYTVGADYLFCDDWMLGLKFNWKQFWASRAHYKAEHHHEEGSSSVKDLNWCSYNIALIIGYKF